MLIPAAVLAATLAAAKPVTVAVSYFDNNSGQPDLAPLSKGLADMLITDLAGVPGLQVVERARLNEALAELRLSQTRFIDPATAQKLGRGVAARYVLTGGYTLVGATLRIDARVFEVQTGAVRASEHVAGRKDEFFALEGQLVQILARAIQLNLGRDGPSQLARGGGTRSFEAWSRYSAGLDAQDRGDAARAREMFEQALRADPAYRAARNARERLAAVFGRESRETTAAADSLLATLSPSAPDFAQRVETLLSSLDTRKADQLDRKLKILSWLGERRLMACARREGPGLPSITVVNAAVPVGGVVSHCQHAAGVLMIAYRLREDPTQWEAVPRVCEYWIHQLPGDKALLQYCEMLLDSIESGRRRGEKESRKRWNEQRKDAAKLPADDWRRVLADNDAAMKAMLAIYTRAADAAVAPAPSR